ncbi:hypothetical protein [Alsobacter sp. R-9]
MQTIRDPGLDDILSEPMIVRLMASDRIRAEDARALYAEVSVRIRERAKSDTPADHPAVRREKGIVYA